MRLLIASRKSDLARLQSYLVSDAIKKVYPEADINFEFTTSFGDQNPDAALWEMPEKGVFTEDLRKGIENGNYDIVVHSWKDLPSDITTTSKIYTLKRADSRDILLVKKSSFKKILNDQTISIFSSSPRRLYQAELSLRKLLPQGVNKLKFHPIRGNINTRVRKLVTGDIDSLIVAKAAIDRLLNSDRAEFKDTQKELREYLEQCHWIVLPLSLFPTAAAQGALAIETRADRFDIHQVLEKINHSETKKNVLLEREILRNYGGGCHQKIGINFTSYPFGVVKSLIGETQEGEKIREYDLEKTTQSISSKYWPKEKRPNIFKREYLSVEIPENDIFVSHHHALPKNFVQKNKKIWCSGIVTWQKLASRGLWVNGSYDSLGEEVAQNLHALVGRQLNFIKLTHQKSNVKTKYPTLVTYNLHSLSNIENLTEYDDFFWFSGSQFLYALERFPHIKSKRHFCGPGNTYKTIKKYIEKNKLHIYLTYEHWLSDRL